MLMAMLHGLGIRKQPTPAEQTFNNPITNAHLAPLGKSYGSYVIDSLSAQSIVTTSNLPDVTGYLKNVKVDFLLERMNTANGDFVVAQAEPTFPSNLGAPIIDQQYLDGLKGRKFIAYLVSNVWTPWKEINSGSDFTAKFLVNSTPLDLYLDPITVREYFVELSPSSVLNLTVGAYSKFTKPISLDIAPVSNSYTVNWPAGVVWTNSTQTAPTNVPVGSRLHVQFYKDNTGQILGDATVYKVS